jgi:hypothetical protein
VGQRTTFLEALDAGRAAIARAAEAGCSGAAMRTMLGVVACITLWSKTEDRIALAQIAQAVGLNGPASKQQVGRHLRELHRAGAIVYEPGRGEGHYGRIRLPEVVRTAPLLGSRSSANRPQEVVRTAHRSSANGATIQGVSQEGNPPKGARAARRAASDGSAYAGHPGGVLHPDDWGV